MFATDVSRPGWIEDHAHLTDFALTYLEADVMLFRSGYVKRHMLVRLRQARLSPGQIGRARRLVELAVLNGSGLEEFREYCRLAARLITRELQGWLEDTAREAMLTLDALDIDDWRRAQEAFDDKTFRKLHKGWFRHRRTWSFPANFTPQLVKTAELPHRNRVHVNAWRMLRQIERISQGTRP